MTLLWYKLWKGWKVQSLGDLILIYAWALRSPLKSHSTLLTRANSTSTTALSADTVEKERKKLVEQGCCFQNNCKIYERSARMEGNQRSADSQVQQLTQKNSSTPHLKNTKLEEKGKTVEGWKYPTSPGSFPEICVRSRTITVWNESDHWLKLILEREFLFSNPQQPGIKIPIGHFWLQNCNAKGKAFGTFFLVKFCCPHDSK